MLSYGLFGISCAIILSFVLWGVAGAIGLLGWIREDRDAARGFILLLLLVLSIAYAIIYSIANF
jgi:hypothetical protein